MTEMFDPVQWLKKLTHNYLRAPVISCRVFEAFYLGKEYMYESVLALAHIQRIDEDLWDHCTGFHKAGSQQTNASLT